MASAWEFVKRHKTKLALAGGLIASSVYAGRAYYNSNFTRSTENVPNFHERLFLDADADDFVVGAEDANDTLSDMDLLQMDSQSARKIYVFNSNQKTCESTLTDLIPTLKNSISRRYNIEALLVELKSGSDIDKVAMWQTIKVMSISRLYSAAYSYALLILSLKIQIGIVAGDIYAQSEAQNKQKKIFDFNQMFESFLGRNSPFAVSQSTAKQTSANTQQIFLQALQYFLTQGCDCLAEKIDRPVRDIVSGLSLKQAFSLKDLKCLFAEISSKIHADPACRHFYLFVAPLLCSRTEKIPVSSFGDAKLTSMLSSLKFALESRQFNEIFSFFVDEFLRCSIDFLRHNKLEWSTSCSKLQIGPEKIAKSTISSDATGKTSSLEDFCASASVEAIPLAKLVPTLSDCFHFVSKTDKKSIVDRLLNDGKLTKFCMQIFENFASM